MEGSILKDQEQKDVQTDVKQNGVDNADDNSTLNLDTDSDLNATPKEKDITAKLKPYFRYGLPILIVVVVALVFGIFKWQQSHGTLEINNAKVASANVQVQAQADGNLTQLLVNDGDKVEAGQVIAKMKVVATPEQIADLQKAYDEAKTNFDNLQSQVRATTTTTRTVTVPSAVASAPSGPSGDVAGAQARLDAAAANKQKMEKLYSIGAISATEYAEAQSEYTSAQAALRSASVPASAPAQTTTTRQVQEAVPAAPSPELAAELANAQIQLQQAQAALEQAQSDDNYADITAPVSGIVSLTDFKEGDDLKQNDVIVNISNTQELWVEAPLTEAQYAVVRPGQFVQYTIDNANLTGTVLEVTHAGDSSDSSDGSSDTATITAAKISLPDEMLDQVLPGTEAKVKISLDK